MGIRLKCSACKKERHYNGKSQVVAAGWLLSFVDGGGYKKRMAFCKECLKGAEGKVLAEMSRARDETERNRGNW